jgi:hypothetical protein
VVKVVNPLFPAARIFQNYCVSAEVSQWRIRTDTGVSDEAEICVHHGGHCYLTTRAHAGIFLRRVQSLADQGASELVPLLHDGGLDLLFIGSNVPLQVHDARDRSMDRSHKR